ncbi:hypothetical protein [Enterovibrio nigricans]|uniref:Uncharacterized protein n=1 Tax=Enterovibrio nigricans DSM 22720 TaxID=1121868 RepID=A0A1T4VBZ0_9GAMM|nr:hypothetical protein [Enterovibrio nigricans]PKF49969.1 hypothetical protein AT251_14865 [Enterovibrio nigricans]SKA62418.1 hypothetical protein SAMN02745132_03615 [Enterovibrio nigricans DSM 22720]
MSKFKLEDLKYRGESNGVHSWNLAHGQPYYWHPDWLHVAEDITGQVPLAEGHLDVKEGEKATHEHALRAILKHINEWVHKSHH